MASTTLNLRIQPFRLLTRAEAAHYCRRSARKFEAQCPVPPVKMADGDLLYDVHDLDKWIEGLKAGAGGEDDDIIARLG